MKRISPFTLALLLVTLGSSANVYSAPPKPIGANIDNTEAVYVGRSVCGECHADQLAAWRGSHHDLAMQEASEANVLGNFDNAVFEHSGGVTTFSRRDGDFFVRTDDPDGKLRDYRVVYTFGVEPLQQYLVDVGQGALQALAISWDSRPASEGGQRWFHLYGESVAHDDPLHWSGALQNWNHMCADCHSTGLEKGYDAAAHRFETTWEEIDVSCEACHGPGSRHAAAAREGVRDGSRLARISHPRSTATAQWHALRGFRSVGLLNRVSTMPARPSVAKAAYHAPLSRLATNGCEKCGLVVDLRRQGRWHLEDGEDTARLTGGTVTDEAGRTATDACGRCHSRRAPVASYEHGGNLHDAFSVALLEEHLYHADGQILDEVYVYGSFLQSRMHAAGVTCADCHEPHSATLRLEGNALCTQCHRATTYNTPAHHHHPDDNPGAACVNCHMPARNYMVVDPRRDHSFRVPRPDLAHLGVPNPCTGCHTERDDTWAAKTVARWGAKTPFHYGEALHAARVWQTDAEALLLRTVDDAIQPPIVRASALAAMRPYLSPTSLAAVEQGLVDPHPLVRGGALRALEGVEPSLLYRLASPLLDDPVRTVRIAAARLLAWAADGPTTRRDTLTAALKEYRDSLQQHADRPDTYLHLGDLESQQGDIAAAEKAYRRALEMSPSLAVAAINLSDLYRATGRDEAGEALLRRAVARDPQDAGLQQALGFAQIRLGHKDSALAALRKAYELAPEAPGYAYIYGLALHDLGDREKGLQVLAQAHQRFPGERTLAAGYRALAGSLQPTAPNK